MVLELQGWLILLHVNKILTGDHPNEKLRKETFILISRLLEKTVHVFSSFLPLFSSIFL